MMMTMMRKIGKNQQIPSYASSPTNNDTLSPLNNDTDNCIDNHSNKDKGVGESDGDDVRVLNNVQ